MRIKTAVFPVAGLGTRFLPATKVVPKEVLTLVDRPLIQYAVDEARAAGIERFIFVTSRGKHAIADYFDAAPELEAALLSKGRTDLIEDMAKSDLPTGVANYVRQREPLGLGHAVLCAREIVGSEPFAVLLADDVITADRPCLSQMLDAYYSSGLAGRAGSMVALMDVPRCDVSKYGMAKVAGEATSLLGGRRSPMHALCGLVEKPSVEAAPSTLAVVGRYILGEGMMDVLSSVRPGVGGEIQLTDAISSEIERGRPTFGFNFQGRRFDCGSKAGFLQATVAFALERPDLREEFLEFLRTDPSANPDSDSLALDDRAA